MTVEAAVIERADKHEVVAKVKDVIAEMNMKLSLRQIYYRLVAKQVFENNINEYKRLSYILVEARKKGLIEYEAMEDRTRSFNSQFKFKCDSIDDDVDSLVNYVLNHQYAKPRCLTQGKLHIIGLEKQALETFFERLIPSDSNVILVVCRGYNSLSQIYSLSEEIKQYTQIQEIHCSYFGDHDPTGHDIPRNFQQQLSEFNIHFDSFTRIAVNPDQIKEFKLPEAPAKPSDSRSAKWVGGCVEVDAIPPPNLAQIIENQIEKFWDEDAAKQIDEENIELNTEYRQKLKARLEAEFS